MSFHYNCTLSSAMTRSKIDFLPQLHLHQRSTFLFCKNKSAVLTCGISLFYHFSPLSASDLPTPHRVSRVTTPPLSTFPIATTPISPHSTSFTPQIVPKVITRSPTSDPTNTIQPALPETPTRLLHRRQWQRPQHSQDAKDSQDPRLAQAQAVRQQC